MTELYDAFMADLIHERDKNLTECDNNIIAEFIYDNTDDIVKKEQVDCCVCLTTRRGIQMPNCEHFVCARCHYKMQNGFISDTFYNTYRRPFCGQQKPEYPYKDISENAEIYKTLPYGDWYEGWFINSNEELYKCLKQEEEFMKYIPHDKYGTNIQSFNSFKKWFETNEKIQEYETALTKFYTEYKLFEAQNDLYDRLYEEEKKKNCMKRCPLCRS
jgi:hypothetical protein